ncbi:large tegument protein-like protein [Ovine gammaherpesvirus 2]|uniref:Large tegument protein-like protein n=1 Tax=Ovine gammaherpesvirus 2 TaxID=10398 RepID=A1BM54_9GAMA|nr:large tegument protein-like protein [Ovine gammaherpesvirus 2]
MASQPALSRSLVLRGTASTHQGHCKFGPYAGSQCLSVCVYYLTSSYISDSPLTSRNALDDVLLNGSLLDRILRTENFIPHNEFAQLSNIPKVLITHQWACAVETSPELHGLLQTECGVRAPFIMSLRKALELNYFDIPQYIVYICNGKSGAIIIKNSTYFIFDPHCTSSRDAAAVLSSTSADSVVAYVGKATDEYTACHLYFIPSQHSQVPVNEYLLAHYGIPSSLQRSGAQVNLKTMVTSTIPPHTQAASQTIDTPQAKPGSQPPQAPPGISSETRPKFTIVETPPEPTPAAPIPPKHKTIPGALSLSTALHNATVKRKRPAASPIYSNTESDDSESHKKSTSKKLIKPDPGDLGAVETFWLDDEIVSELPLDEACLPGDAPAEAQRGSGWSSESMFDSDSSSPPNTPLSDPKSPAGASRPTSDEAATDSSGSHSQDPNYYRLDFSDEENLGKAFARLEEHIERVSSFPHQANMPIITDQSLDKSYREAVALHTIDSLLTKVIVEQGLVSKLEHEPQALNVLRYLAIWLDKLSVPASQVHNLIKSGLYIPNLYRALLSGEFSGELEAMLAAKLARCLGTLHAQTSQEVQNFTRAMRTSLDNTLYHDELINAQAEADNIAAVVSIPYFALTSEEASSLFALAAQLWQGISQHNSDVSYEEAEFQRAVNAIESYLPVPDNIKPLSYMVTTKTERLAQVVSQLVANLTQETIAVSDNMLQSLGNDDSISTDIPDFYSLRTRISTTLANIATSKSNLGLHNPELQLGYQQLAYLGHEISTITNSSWSTDYLPPVTPVPQLKTIQAQLKARNADKQNQETLKSILDEVESMLQAAKANTDEQGMQKLAMLLPSIEAYLENAGTLLGPQGNAQFERLRREINELIRSIDIMVASVKNISIPTLTADAQSIATFPQSSKQQEAFQSALKSKVEDLFAEINEALKTDRPPTFSANDMAALESLARLSQDPALATAAALYGQITALLKTKPTYTVPLLDIAHLKSRLATASISSGSKRSLYKLLTQLKRESLQNPPPGDSTSREVPPPTSTPISIGESKKESKPKLPHRKKKAPPKPVPPSQSGSSLSSPEPEPRPSSLIREKADRLPQSDNGPPPSQGLDTAAAVPLPPNSETSPSTSPVPSEEDNEESMETQTELPPASPMDDLTPYVSSNVMDIDEYFPEPQYSSTGPEGAATGGPGLPTEPLSSLIRSEEHHGSEQAWRKIQTAFKTLSFASLTHSDWMPITSGNWQPDSKIAESLGPTLEKLMQPLLQKLKSMVTGAALSLVDSSYPFQWPTVDWITPYRDNVLFYLNTVSYPNVVDLAAQSQVEISVLLQLRGSTSLVEGSAGTYLEASSRDMLNIIAAIEDAASDYKLHVHTDVEKWTHAILNIKNTGESPPPKPEIITPSKLLDPTAVQTVASFDKAFQDYIHSVEQRLLADLTNDFQLLKLSVTETEKNHLQWESTTNRQLQELINQCLQNAPPAVHQHTVPHDDPLTFFLPIVHEAENSAKLTYREALTVLQWAESACTYLAMHCQAPSISCQLQNVMSRTSNARARMEANVLMEDSVKNTDDVSLIQSAISSLDPKRVTGGPKTVQEWTQKATSLNKMMLNAQLEASTAQSIQLIKPLALAARCSNLLANLKHKTAALSEKWSKEKQPNTGSEVTSSIEELDRYLTFKLKFIEHYETNQVPIFSMFILQSSKRSSRRSQISPATPSPLAEDASPFPVNFLHRLHALCLLRPSAAAPAWMQTFPTIDNIGMDYLPLKSDSPLSLQILFDNFLETHFVQLVPPPKQGLQQFEGSTVLPGIATAHRGLILARTIDAQWNNIVDNSSQALQSYTALRDMQGTDRQNEFMAIIVSIHGLLQALSAQAPTAPAAQDEYTILLGFKTILEVLLWIWPGVIYLFLRMPSFQEGVLFLQRIIANCLSNLTVSFALQQATGRLAMAGVPEPSGLLFCPKYWKQIDPSMYVWGDAQFLQLCQNSPDKARACFLAYVIQAVNDVVLGQLWRSFKPAFLPDARTPHDLLHLLVEQSYRTNFQCTITSKTVTDQQPPYVYGLPGNTIFQVNKGTAPAPGSPKIPLTAFELAAAALLRKLNPIFYLSPNKPTVTHPDVGDIFTVSKLIDLRGKEEPFASLLSTPLQAASENPSAEAIYTELEQDVFMSQKLWLQQHMRRETREAPLAFPVVLVDSTNKVLGAYDLDEEGVRLFPTIHFKYDKAGVPQWPSEVLSVSTLTQERPHALDAQMNTWVTEIDALSSSLSPNNLFSTYPPELYAPSSPLEHSSSPESPSPPASPSPPTRLPLPFLPAPPSVRPSQPAKPQLPSPSRPPPHSSPLPLPPTSLPRPLVPYSPKRPVPTRPRAPPQPSPLYNLDEIDMYSDPLSHYFSRLTIDDSTGGPGPKCHNVNYLVPPHTDFVNLQPTDPHRVIVGSLRAVNSQNVFTPAKPRYPIPPGAWPRELPSTQEAFTFRLPPKPPLVSTPPKKHVYSIVQAQPHEDPKVPLLPLEPIFIDPTPDAYRHKLSPAELQRALRLKRAYVHQKPTGQAPSSLATITPNYLSIHEIIADSACLVAPRPPFISIDRHMDPQPLMLQFILETSIDEAKHVLITFICRIRQVVRESAQSLASSVQRLAALYL